MIDLKDIAYKPTIDEIQEYIGNDLFHELYQYMNREYQAICTVAYSKDTWLRGWNVKFRKAGKSLCVVYPKNQYFTVLVVEGNKERETVQALFPQLTPEIQKIYRETKEGMGQRWLMINLKANDAVYRDVLKLIHIRREAK